jgi:hypothetical protein
MLFTSSAAVVDRCQTGFVWRSDPKKRFVDVKGESKGCHFSSAYRLDDTRWLVSGKRHIKVGHTILSLISEFTWHLRAIAVVIRIVSLRNMGDTGDSTGRSDRNLNKSVEDMTG